jgi:hypothetical protein
METLRNDNVITELGTSLTRQYAGKHHFSKSGNRRRTCDFPQKHRSCRTVRRNKKKKLRGFQSASELYRLSDRRGRRSSARGQRGGSPRSLIPVFYTGAATSFPSSSSFILTRLSGSHSRPTAFQKIWQRQESKPEPVGLQPGTLTTRPCIPFRIKIV